MRIDRAGWPFLAVPLASAVVSTVLGRGSGPRWARALAWPLLALSAYMAVFFRDPDRRCDSVPPSPEDVLSPADGVVMVAGEPQPDVAPDDAPEGAPEVDPIAPGEDPGATPQSDPEVVPSGPQVVPEPGADPDTAPETQPAPV